MRSRSCGPPPAAEQFRRRVLESWGGGGFGGRSLVRCEKPPPAAPHVLGPPPAAESGPARLNSLSCAFSECTPSMSRAHWHVKDRGSAIVALQFSLWRSRSQTGRDRRAAERHAFCTSAAARLVRSADGRQPPPDTPAGTRRSPTRRRRWPT